MPSFWGMRRGARANGATALEVAEQHEPVEIYTDGALITGKVASHGQRLSDLLNSSSMLRVKDPNPNVYEDGMSAGPAAPDSWHSIETDDILFVMPPEHLSARQLRVHRRQRRVRITIGDFELVGTAHTAPGTELNLYTLRQRSRFLPLTKAVAYSNMDPAWERAASVILVNLVVVKDLTEMFTIA